MSVYRLVLLQPYKLCGKKSVHGRLPKLPNDSKLFWINQCQAKKCKSGEPHKTELVEKNENEP